MLYEVITELNLRAGVRAKQSAAYEAAMNYLRVAAALLPADPWREMPALMQTLAAETQQCAYLTGRADEAEDWIEVMLQHAGSDLERSDILAIRTRQYATLGRMEESILSAIHGLAMLGLEFSDRPTAADIAEERVITSYSIHYTKLYEGARIQRVLIGALADDLQVFGMQPVGRLQVEARVPDDTVLGAVGA